MSTPDRKSDAFVEVWQETIRYLTDAMAGSPVDELLKDHIRARAREEVQAERIAALEDELSSLKPSGQVAESIASLMSTIRDFATYGDDTQTEDLVALSCLATKAQGYEAIRAALAKNYGAGGDPLERVKDLLESEEQANSEARIEKEERHRVELERDLEATRAEKAEQERDAAVADSAAWRIAALAVAPAVAVLARAPEVAPDIRSVLLDAEATFLVNAKAAQPGAALLEQHRKELVRARNEAMERVAKRMESIGTGPIITSATLLAKNVRAMMEPES